MSTASLITVEQAAKRSKLITGEKEQENNIKITIFNFEGFVVNFGIKSRMSEEGINVVPSYLSLRFVDSFQTVVNVFRSAILCMADLSK